MLLYQMHFLFGKDLNPKRVFALRKIVQ